MSQATFDPTASGGSSDDAGETRPTRGQGAGARRRPTRRGHAASAKTAAEATTQPTTTPALTTPESAPSAAPVTTPVTTPAAPAPAATASATEEAARGGTRRSRSGAKRPATRGKAGAQLIITKTEEEAQSEAAAESVAQGSAPVVEGVAEPVVVPVVTAGAEQAAPPAEPRKTRFGLPRRFRQPEAAIPAPAEPAAVVTEPIVEQPAAAEQPAPTPTEPSRRYRFERARGTTIPGAATPRPERISATRPGLYTTPTPESVAEPAVEPLFELPSLESLVGGAAGAELPTLAFEEPAALVPTEQEAAESATAEEGEQFGEGAELGEGAGGVSRRRRRRRRGAAAHNGAHGAELEEAAEEEEQPTSEAEAETPEAAAFYGEEAPAIEPAEPTYQEPRETRATYTEAPTQRGRAGRFGYPGRASHRAPAEPAWEAPAPTPAPETTSPYGSPEPSFSRGFGPTPSGVAAPVRESYPRPSRVERGGDQTAASIAQLGSVMREAINTQTDRLLNELRRQQPPAVTVSIPNALSSERVGIFVDVANVVYSARGLRTSVDFGNLLDFLRANRRLARAQAYSPTNPEPGAEQTFLSAVKGMGYRITTKNYKTFSNGAKKADLDLDLCMDIVRIVEARAVDTIVLVSGDSDFLPLLDYCSDHGVRVEVAAFDDAASMILRQSCDLFVNLSLVDGIRG